MEEMGILKYVNYQKLSMTIEYSHVQCLKIDQICTIHQQKRMLFIQENLRNRKLKKKKIKKSENRVE